MAKPEKRKLIPLPDGSLITVDPRGWRVAAFCHVNGIVVCDVLADSEADAKGVAERLMIENKLVNRISSMTAQQHSTIPTWMLETNPPKYQ